MVWWGWAVGLAGGACSSGVGRDEVPEHLNLGCDPWVSCLCFVCGVVIRVCCVCAPGVVGVVLLDVFQLCVVSVLRD